MSPHPRRLRLAPDVVRAIRSLHPDLKRRVRRALDRLCIEPDGGKMLTQELSGWRSLRVGRVRIIYRPQRTAIEVAAIGPRSSIYLDAATRLRCRSGATSPTQRR